MTNGEAALTVERQNDVMITLLARLVWKPEELAELLSRGKRNPAAYLKVYNLLDGAKTGRQLAEAAGVTQQAMSFALQGWEELGLVMNIGSQAQPRYKRLMNVPERGNKEKKSEARRNG